MSGDARFDPEAAAAAVRRRAGGRRPRVQLVLGSGLSPLAGALDRAAEIPFGDVPGLPSAGVAGHAGRFVVGRLEGDVVLVQAGRFHLYEGHRPELVTAPVRIGARLGVEAVILTNAAGGIHPALAPGSILLLADQIDLTFRTPLRERALRQDGLRRATGAQSAPAAGPTPSRARGLPTSAPYDRDLQARALEVAGREGIRLVRGTYAGVLGPSYETRAEIRMLSRMGADAVGMSTVSEVVEARASGVPALGLSLITNRAAGLGGGPLGHEDVVATAERTGARLGRVVRAVLRSLFREDGAEAFPPEADRSG